MSRPVQEAPASTPSKATPTRPIFLLILGLWLVLPVVVMGNLAQDALPYVVAGRLVGTQPDQIYATEARDLYDLKPAFAATSCDLAPAGTDCANLAVAFVSAPPALLFAALLGWAGPTFGILLARLLASAALAGGMLVLWNRLSGRHPDAPAFLVATALLLTPFAMVPIALGQTSPYLFLAACVGVARTGTRTLRALLTAGLVVGCILLKLFPAVALAVLVYQRRWRLLGWIVAWGVALVALAAVLLPFDLWRDFLTTSRLMAAYSLVNPYNGSVDGVLHGLSASLATGPGGVASLAVRAAAVVAVFAWRVRHADDDTQWGYAWLASLLFVPLVWWHYLWLAVAAVGLALAGRRHLDRRQLWILPILAAVAIPISIPNGSGSAVPWAQLLFLLAAVVAVPLLVERPARPAAPAEPDASGRVG